MNQIEGTAAEHQDIGEMLPWFVNGRLSEADRQRVDAHLRVCEACSDELAAQQPDLFPDVRGRGRRAHADGGTQPLAPAHR